MDCTCELVAASEAALGLLFLRFFLSTPAGEAGPEPLSLSLPPVKPLMHSRSGLLLRSWLGYEVVKCHEEQDNGHAQPVLRSARGVRGYVAQKTCDKQAWPGAHREEAQGVLVEHGARCSLALCSLGT